MFSSGTTLPDYSRDHGPMKHPAWTEPTLLRPGDRLSLDEFLERWNQSPALKRAELIDGTVYMPSPVSALHGKYDNLIQGLVSLYCMRTPGTEAFANSTWLMTASSAPQPDCAIRIVPELGGRSSLRNGLLLGAP